MLQVHVQVACEVQGTVTNYLTNKEDSQHQICKNTKALIGQSQHQDG